jgi:hypothetical protein
MDFIVDLLRPGSLADIFIYAIFFTALGVLFTMPEKNEIPLYLVFAVIFACIVDLMRMRVQANGGRFPIPGADAKGFFTFILHIAMAMIPFITAGMIRRRGRKGAASIPLAILGGIIGCLYAMLAFISANTVYDKIF